MSVAAMIGLGYVAAVALALALLKAAARGDDQAAHAARLRRGRPGYTRTRQSSTP